MKTKAILKDALYNTHEKSGASVDYAQGVIVGAVSTLMACKNLSFEEAWRIVYNHLPVDYRKDSIPEAWR